MKFARFTVHGEQSIRQGVVTDSGIKEISGNIFGKWVFTGEEFAGVKRFNTPIKPNQVIGIGANYVKETKDLPETLPEIPVFFFKPTSSVIGPDEEVSIPSSIEKVQFESELAIVMGKQARQISESEVDDVIFGFTIANDVTAPQFFHEDGHKTIGKSFDTFTPLGPVLETDLDIDSVYVEAFVNGTQKQDSPTNLMIISIRKMISYLTHVMTLSPGDVILTGSPAGADFLQDGDVIECKIEGIGTLRNTAVSSEIKV